MLQGLAEVPAAGDILRAVVDEKKARAMVDERRAAQTTRPEGTGRATLEDLYRQIQAGQTKELRIILKADVQGSLGAVVHALDQIQTEEVRINVLLQGTGDITDNDINLASASDAVVVGFNAKMDATSRRSAEAAGVEVRTYDIIYKLTDDMEAALRGMLEPEIVEVVEGRAEVRQIFRVGKTQVIAGSYVHPGPHRPRRRARVPGQQAHRHGQGGLAPPLPGRRARGRDRLRVRYRPARVPRARGGRHHRELHHAGGVARRRELIGVTERTARLDQLLREEISAIIAKDIADPRVGFVTVTEVDVTNDLSHADGLGVGDRGRGGPQGQPARPRPGDALRPAPAG